MALRSVYEYMKYVAPVIFFKLACYYIFGIDTATLASLVFGLFTPAELPAGQIYNPNLLSLQLHKLGFHIQSSILGIPHQWGLFTPCAPRVQIHQVLFFSFLFQWWGLQWWLLGYVARKHYRWGRPVRHLAVFEGVVFCTTAYMWVLACNEYRHWDAGEAWGMERPGESVEVVEVRYMG
ncbi:Uu.00g006180.m01.CDS01 [Anthostomella pinea]|uniref:Uu.00g006180.m01.CDS01 n=1 Tax=Anthostomella pinea TaxID=933095 RepID=A0AAI8VEX9_9PEZI|nr:Uu.00g006180.m01.CDS01 [Anthostomella pinea]